MIVCIRRKSGSPNGAYHPQLKFILTGIVLVGALGGCAPRSESRRITKDRARRNF